MPLSPRASQTVKRHLFPLVIGIADGILTALTLAAGRLLSAERLGGGLALRIAVAAAVSSAFVFFIAEYSSLRAELVQFEKYLSLRQPGKLASTQLGRKALRRALLGALISAGSSFLGALVPLGCEAIFPKLRWLPLAIALSALALLGVSVGHSVHGRPWLWSLALVLAGILLSVLGAALRIV